MIDFGLSRKYLDGEGIHILKERTSGFYGSLMTASKNAYYWRQSRRDDIIQVLYMLIYLIRGTLPWIEEECANKNDFLAYTKRLKNELTAEDLC